ncbi:uncharacterized protein (DUF58 family) [Kineosphaera limosa]|uniref:DUF58 domain-containing protein n=1 Tax=Kineosphaera limosa NBRC 100340 TaxID=1184609 RepID=K6WAT0_9MICO|nr:DUF58 domain-containing protein [Kineosphaera limosa]NYD99272.1 uncharacterized protein (DUF58 family) [Kineosphaera limosa]GAB96310.1 hypothetical protein KILIM_034_00590 [Kineosphaera limosa NBRC 100340]
MSPAAREAPPKNSAPPARPALTVRGDAAWEGEGDQAGRPGSGRSALRRAVTNGKASARQRRADGRRGPDGGRRGFTDRGRALLAAGVTFVLSGMALGFVDLTRVGLLLVALPLIALLAYQGIRPRLDVQRRASPPTVTVGQNCTVHLQVHNPSAYPSLTAFAQEQLPLELGEPARFLLPGVPRRGTRLVEYTVRAARRGRHQLGPLAVRTSDPFGLTTSLTPIPGSSDVVALPPVHVLAGRPGLLGGAGNSGSDILAPGATGVDDASLREYQLGDDLRRIHWPVTAHRGELTVRHDGRAPVRQAVLCLDPSLPISGAGDSPALEWAVEALASIAHHLLAQGYLLTLVTPQQVAAGTHSQHLTLEQTLMALAVVAPDDGRLLRSGRSVQRGVASPGRTAAASPTASPGAATESPLITAARDAAASGGLMVLVAGTNDPQTAHDLLGTLPARTTGIALLLEAEAFGRHRGPARPQPTQQSPAPSHRVGRRRDAGAAHDLAAFAASGGWRTRLVRGPELIDAVWDDVAGVRGP